MNRQETQLWAGMPRTVVSRIAVAALGLVLLAGAALAHAEELPKSQPAAKPSAGKSLDQELLKDLDNELLDDAMLDDSGKRPAKKAKSAAGPSGGAKPKAAPGGKEQPQEPSPGEAEPGQPAAPAGDDETMGEDIGQGPEDPLARIGRQMRKVERLIEQQKTTQPSEELRQQIIRELAKLIDELEQQRQQQSNSSNKSLKPQGMAQRESVKQSKQSAAAPGSGNSSKPARDSSERLGRNEVHRPDPEQMKGMMKDLWGQLPAHAREQMLQTSPEQFVPRYELQIEKYYKRLAEQQKHNP